MRKVKFYEISEDEVKANENPGKIVFRKKPVFVIIIENEDLETVTIDNNIIKENILKDKDSNLLCIEVTDEEKNESRYTVKQLDGSKDLEINLKEKNEFLDNPISGIEKFQVDRLLDKQPFNFKTEVLNILEELVEMTGEESETARKIAEEIFDNYFKDKSIVNDETLIDCFTDIRVFSIGATMKLGYDPKCTLAEVAKEINSRTGKIVDGKFIKDKSPEARAKWYKADFSKCSIYKRVKDI